MRYKCCRAADGLTHVLCRFGCGNDPATDPFERLPDPVRKMGPWTGSHVHRKATAFHPEVETRRYVPAQR